MPKKSWKDTELFGMWSHRDDMKDPVKYLRKLRKPRFPITPASATPTKPAQ